MIEIDDDLEAIERALWLYRKGQAGLKRPHCGKRGDHSSTAIIVAMNNRAAALRR